MKISLTIQKPCICTQLTALEPVVNPDCPVHGSLTINSKTLYEGIFNYSGELFKLYTHANSPERAFLNFMSQLSKKLEVNKRAVMYRFNGSKDNYYVKEVV
ncbi:MAG: hypothetical protein EHM49_00605 [Deltaproteobacteria bacterium]|nr:MAG: hypothetical protein EHM49_00605 [Deltaproteobacteria bacterium]